MCHVVHVTSVNSMSWHGPVGPSSLLHRRCSQAETPPLFPSLASLNTSPSPPPQGVVPGCQRLRARCNPLPHLRCLRLAWLTRCKNPSTASLHGGRAGHTVRHCCTSSPLTQSAEDGERGAQQHIARVERVQCIAV